MPATAPAHSKPATEPPFGAMLRRWRGLRGMSQLGLALEAETSARHLSFLETGRARPSREMALRLAESLDLPLRERNAMLVAAGFAPIYGNRPLDDADLSQARRALDFILERHDPFPALVADRGWNLVMANRGAVAMMGRLGLPKGPGPLNIIKLLVDPDGVRPALVNWAETVGHMLSRVAAEARARGDDPVLSRLLAEARAFPDVPAREQVDAVPQPPLLELIYEIEGQRTRWFSTVTSFGTACDATLQDLKIEAFHPADAATEAVARAWAAAG